MPIINEDDPKENTLTKQQAEEWAVALESGKYIQENTHHCMRHTYPDGTLKQCCLDVLMANIIKVPFSPNGSPPYPNEKRLLTGEMQSHFILMNDQDGFTFPEIAAQIREKLIPNLRDE